MVDLFPTPATTLIESTTTITDTVPAIGNVAILADTPNPVSKVCFGASCLFGVAGADSEAIKPPKSLHGRLISYKKNFQVS